RRPGPPGGKRAPFSPGGFAPTQRGSQQGDPLFPLPAGRSRCQGSPRLPRPPGRGAKLENPGRRGLPAPAPARGTVFARGALPRKGVLGRGRARAAVGGRGRLVRTRRWLGCLVFRRKVRT